MHEYATALMRSSVGWLEQPTGDATFLFMFGDASMTVFPDGSWECRIPNRLRVDVRRGDWRQLQQFLNEFALANPT